MPKIDVARLNTLRPKPKPSEQPPEPVRTPSDDEDDPMEEDRVSTGRTLRRRKEKVAKDLKRGANKKEKENFQKRKNSGGIVRDLEVQIVGAVCNLQTNQLCLTPIDPNVHYDPIPVNKPQTIPRRINDPGIIAACHCGAECESDNSKSIDTHPVTSIDARHPKSTHTEGDESRASTKTAYYKSVDPDFNRVRDGDYSIGSWADEHHHESFAVETTTYTPGADKLQDSFTDEELLNMQKRDDTDQIQAEAAWERTRFSQSIDTRHQQSIDTRHQQSIDTLPQQSIDTNNTTSIDNRPIPKTTVSEQDKLNNQYITPDEFGIFRDHGGYAKAIDGRTLHVSREDIADILQTANGADNLFMHQRSNPEQKTTKEFYDTAGDIENSFKQLSRHTTHPSINIDVPTVARQLEFGRRAYDLYGNRKFYWEEKDEYGVYRDDREFARDLDGHIIPVHNKDIRRLLERASRDEPAYICLPEHANSFTQTKLVPEIYTKDEIDEMFYGVCGEHERNKETFQMKLDGVYYPLNDSISWLTTCMEDMKQDIAIIQNATDIDRPPSIDKRRPQSIDRHHHTSIDNRLTASIDTNPPRPHTMKSQPNFHTREEIDQLVEGIYRALKTTEERLDGRCNDIYFPMDLSISALTSKVEAIQGELVEIQSYIARRPEAALSIDRRNNKSIDIHNQTSIDSDTKRGRVVPKTTSDMSNTPCHGEEISTDTYATLTRHPFNLESLGERLQRIENTTTTMKDKWRRGDEAMRDFTGTWFNKRKEEMDTVEMRSIYGKRKT
ncbi:hypothetical protein F2Q70_00043557 [Brassica cretica]|uniref:Uncharacterized protein n=1 Tax=Brassica cretica TaxID=69181 RepID=A0A8S9KGT5_BRACR|nr:hypothetical protein F2Q70_00043557 [Brassica cretica]